MNVATEYAEGTEPSYGRIIGLSQRIDRTIKSKMRQSDIRQAHEKALKDLMK